MCNCAVHVYTSSSLPFVNTAFVQGRLSSRNRILTSLTFTSGRPSRQKLPLPLLLHPATIDLSLSQSALHHFSNSSACLPSSFSPSLLVALPSSAVSLPVPCVHGQLCPFRSSFTSFSQLCRSSSIFTPSTDQSCWSGGLTSRLPLGSGSMRTPLFSACAASSIITVHNGNRVVISLL